MASLWGFDSTPVKSLKMSVPTATPLGRTMRSSSSIQSTVGTLVMAYDSASSCSRSMSTG